MVWLSGCGAAGNKLALDKSVAHDSLIAFLDAWKKGGTPAELKSREPAIIVNDPDWAAGRKLLEYRLLGSENDDGSNLHAAAELSLQAPRGVVKQQVTYIVGTSPVITIVPQSTVN